MKQRLRRMYFRLSHTPAEVCAKFGHRLQAFRVRGYMGPEWSWQVALAFEKMFFTCKSCGEELGNKITDSHGITSLTMGSDSWSTLRREGMLIRENERVW